MLRRFFQIQENVDIADPELAILMPSHAQLNKLKEIMTELSHLNQLTIYLQSSSLTLLDVRVSFDRVVAIHPEMGKYLSPTATIVHCPLFDSGIIKILNGRESELSPEEIKVLIKLEVDRSTPDIFIQEPIYNNPYIVSSLESCSFSRYINCNLIPPTSNTVERLFSMTKRIYTGNRESLDHATLEEIVFLNKNKDLWDENVVDKAVE